MQVHRRLSTTSNKQWEVNSFPQIPLDILFCFVGSYGAQDTNKGLIFGFNIAFSIDKCFHWKFCPPTYWMPILSNARIEVRQSQEEKTEVCGISHKIAVHPLGCSLIKAGQERT